MARGDRQVTFFKCVGSGVLLEVSVAPPGAPLRPSSQPEPELPCFPPAYRPPGESLEKVRLPPHLSSCTEIAEGLRSCLVFFLTPQS